MAQQLTLAGNDRTVVVWDAATGEQHLVIHGFDGGEYASVIDGLPASCSPGACATWAGSPPCR